MKSIRLGFFLLTLISFISSCHKNSITGRRGLELYPESDMIAMSVTEYQKFLSEHHPLPASDSKVVLVRGVGEKIQHAVEAYFKEKGLSNQLKGYQWEFNVVDENVQNAWCMPGGKVVVYSGILPLTQDEVGLAVVMGHEIAHAIARHGNERMSQGMLVQLGGVALSTAVQNQPDLTRELYNQAYGVSTGLGMLKYSRSHESEADHMGVIFMAMAGYDPEAAVPFWERMASKSGGQAPPEFLSTHPSDQTRINDLKGFIKDAMPYYKK